MVGWHATCPGDNGHVLFEFCNIYHQGVGHFWWGVCRGVIGVQLVGNSWHMWHTHPGRRGAITRGMIPQTTTNDIL